MCAFAVGQDLAHAVPHATARAVEQPLGARRDWADAGGLVQHAVAAHLTALLEHAVPDDVAEKRTLQPREHGLGDAVGRGLDAGTARQHDDGIGSVNLCLVLANLEFHPAAVTRHAADDPAGDDVALTL